MNIYIYIQIHLGTTLGGGGGGGGGYILSRY